MNGSRGRFSESSSVGYHQVIELYKKSSAASRNEVCSVIGSNSRRKRCANEARCAAPDAMCRCRSSQTGLSLTYLMIQRTSPAGRIPTHISIRQPSG